MSKAEAESVSNIFVDPVRVLQVASQLATAPEPDLHIIQLLLSSCSFPGSQENRKRSHETDLKHGRSKKAREDDHITRWPCEVCPCSYTTKSNLKRHVTSAHDKRKLVVTDVFECEECEDTFATQAALETHVDTHATSSTNAKSPKYPCAFCKKKRTNIYNHYGGQHKIDYPEQIMFDTGNVLVHSDINTDKGKAPWFLKEKEKMELYDNVTCRLCEAKTSFNNPEILADHYTLNHMVDPAMLDNLKRLFRAEKGAHLIGLTPSKTPKRRQSNIAKVRAKDPCRMDKKTDTHKDNFKTGVKKSILRVGFDCNECDQFYATEALLYKHKTDKHGPQIQENSKSEKYRCALCHKDVVQIYKHYGNVHNIEYPEQMLFDNGNVLIITVINTNGGQAPWFLSQKEKAESRYTRNTCRLCETVYDKVELLEKHYLSEHRVEKDVLNRLNNLRCLFRSEKGAHLADLPASPAKRQDRVKSHTTRPVNKTESKCTEISVHADHQKTIEEDSAGLIMYQCAECGVAATTCDASVEHAHLHHLTGYKPTPLPCDICSFAFEAEHFANHSTHHLGKNEYKTVEFHPSKLLDDWAEMFQGLSESHVHRIKASSTYQYTRRVKMNSDVGSGIPLYQCSKCELYVRPKDVEGHCYRKTSCVENQAPGHFCSDCEIFFYTGAALTAHEKEHRNYGNDCFRKVTFNDIEDETLNQALQKLQKTNKAPINIIENTVVSKFCNECKKSMLVSEFEAHVAMHQDAAIEYDCNQRTEAEKSGDVASENAVIERQESDVEGTVEQWNSDNDSCLSLQICSEVVHADVHAQNAVEDSQSDPVVMPTKNNEVVATDDVQNAANNSEVYSSHAKDNIIVDALSEETISEIKRDLQHLMFEEFGFDFNK